MYIEEYLALKKNPPKQEGLPLEPLEYTIKPRFQSGKVEVRQHKVGCVFVGLLEEARSYISQQRTKQAIRTAERGLNPFFTR
jgi:hypothetical protein